MNGRDEDLSAVLLASAALVHRELGGGLDEPTYEFALDVELSHRGVPFERAPRFDVFHRGVEVGRARASFTVGGMIVEVVPAIDDRTVARARAIARAADRPQAFVLCFAGSELQARRVLARDLAGGSVFLGCSINPELLAPAPAAAEQRTRPSPVYPGAPNAPE